jgi:glycosyltransferase involved in cell wall biosynthesis
LIRHVRDFFFFIRMLILDNVQALQPAAFQPLTREMTVIVSSLSLGGAQKIILDWASRIAPFWDVHLITIHNQTTEFSVPSRIRLTRLGGGDQACLKLRQIAQKIASSENPVVLAHLLSRKERDLMANEGCFVIPVLHNAKAGWIEDASNLDPEVPVITVSYACARDLRDLGWTGSISTIHHIPKVVYGKPRERRFPEHWKIPENAIVLGMIGGVKPQKDYLHALRILKALNEKKRVYLVILGGPVGRRGAETWHELASEIERSGLRKRICMPGFIPHAEEFITSFNVFFNTSHYEGLSMATLESLLKLCPVVASKVGGQGEVDANGLWLIDKDAPDSEWVAAIDRALKIKREAPSWANFNSYRLWTLHHLARAFEPTSKALFITGNLNSGGAQRSLVNLARELSKEPFGAVDFEIAVAGASSTDRFFQELKAANVKVFRAGDSEQTLPFDHAESLTQKICLDRIGIVVFWNLDSKVKLLLTKTLGFTKVKFIDVSPGEDSFVSLEDSYEFQKRICFSRQEFYGRLDHLVLKFNGAVPPEYHGRVHIIPNGIPEPATPTDVKTDYAIHRAGRPAKVVVNGRIAASKFILEIIAAMELVWRKLPDAELHIYGAAESREREYAAKVLAKAKSELGKRIFLHGLNFESKRLFPKYDACVVLGYRQGCPNALLEAMAAGLPCIGNDDGGVREQIMDGETGILLSDCSPESVAQSLLNILSDRALAEKLGRNGRRLVLHKFSMELMKLRYIALFYEVMTKTHEYKNWRK